MRKTVLLMFVLSLKAFSLDGVYNVQDYGVMPDNTDSTSAFISLLTTVNTAGGGTVYFPPSTTGNLYSLGCITFPNDSATIPHQNPLIIEGSGSNQNHPQSAPVYPNAGSVINSTCTSGTSALFDTRGTGSLEVRGLSFVNTSGADVSLFIHTTNTKITIHDNVFAGRVLSSTTPAQDAISLGDSSTTQSGAFNAPFQGYLSTIRDNQFMWMRRGVWCRAYCNGVVIDSNDWMFGSGGGSGYGAIDIYGSGNGDGVAAQGNVITNNIIEASDGTVNYVYPIRITKGLNSYIAGNGCYDSNSSVAGACIYLGSGISANPGTLNIVILNLQSTDNGSFLAYKDLGSNTVLRPGTYGLVAAGGGNDMGVDAASGDATMSTYLAGVRKWSWYNVGASNKFNLYDWTCSCFRYTVTQGATGTHVFNGSDLGSNAPSGDATVSTHIAGTRKWSLYNAAATGHLGIYDWAFSNFALDLQANGGTGIFTRSELMQNIPSGNSIFSLARGGTHHWAIYNSATGNTFSVFNWDNSAHYFVLDANGYPQFPTIGGATGGGGGNYVCADSAGHLYVSATCP